MKKQKKSTVLLLTLLLTILLATPALAQSRPQQWIKPAPIMRER